MRPNAWTKRVTRPDVMRPTFQSTGLTDDPITATRTDVGVGSAGSAESVSRLNSLQFVPTKPGATTRRIGRAPAVPGAEHVATAKTAAAKTIFKLDDKLVQEKKKMRPPEHGLNAVWTE